MTGCNFLFVRLRGMNEKLCALCSLMTFKHFHLTVVENQQLTKINKS